MLRLGRMVVTALLLISLVLSEGCFFYFDFFDLRESHAKAAEEYAAEGRNTEAIEQYRLHMEERLADPTRLEDENPHFYLLLIGDLYLREDDIEEARRQYELALEKEVDVGLTSERLRRLAGWYEERGRFEEAIELLRRHRELDDLIFDLEIDRIHKASVMAEEGIEADKKKNETSEQDDSVSSPAGGNESSRGGRSLAGFPSLT